MNCDDITLAEVGAALASMSQEKRHAIRKAVELMADKKKVAAAWVAALSALFLIVLAAVLTDQDPRLVIGACVAGGLLVGLVVLKALKMI